MQASNGVTPREIQTVLKAQAILDRWGLGHHLDEPLAHLRATYALRRRGLRDYVLDLIGPIANQPLSRFRLYRDLRGAQPLEAPEERMNERLVDYLADEYDHRNLPAMIELVRGREGDERFFFL